MALPGLSTEWRHGRALSRPVYRSGREGSHGRALSRPVYRSGRAWRHGRALSRPVYRSGREGSHGRGGTLVMRVSRSQHSILAR